MSYVDLTAFTQALNLQNYINTERHKLQITVGSTRLKWTADNPFVVVGQKVVQLPARTLCREDRFWVPLEAFVQILRQVYPAKIYIDLNTAVLTILPSNFEVFGIQYDQKENGTLVRILCTRKIAFSPPTMRDNTLSLILPEVKVDIEALTKILPIGVVDSLYAQQSAGTCQLTFKLAAPVLQQSSWQEDDTHQIVLSLVTKIMGASPETLSENTDVDFDEINLDLAREQEKWKIDCVVIDPGHGGKDPGAIGPTGLQEKEVTLAIALRLKGLLEKIPDLKVIMTRMDDRSVGLNQRTRLANQKGGKLFISIHCNSLSKGSATGFETYFLKPARNERAMAVALRENAVIRYEETHNEYQELNNENFILLTMAQSEFARESEYLAGIVQTRMRMSTGLKDRGVDQAGFFVLVNASMPAILVETAFLSTRREEKLLRTKKFRQQVAQALYDSVLEFQRKTHSKAEDASFSR